MEYKTPMVARKLGVSPKVIMRIVSQLQMDVEKNKFGHYIFSEADVNRIIDYYTKEVANTEVAATVAYEVTSAPTQVLDMKPNTIPFMQDERSIKEKISSTELLSRLDRMEEKLDTKADEVVAYQLLQHRNEIEELRIQIQLLQTQLQKLEEAKPLAPIREITADKKRRRMILSIFGF
ncbi:chromosome segregation protein [Ectobacillus sp. JY-23]|uniref:chromosome segregation protein n=1 Tax=Ectobacillus sp. JY-23 TaxID=2933872 RepID=UPI001FF41391|nr:chromosome segregation protein [Ectobacillus sp. JY-23]UOY92935.1 chromosome segregation protein [Ectobacillus sp. JY-23]